MNSQAKKSRHVLSRRSVFGRGIFGRNVFAIGPVGSVGPVSPGIVRRGAVVWLTAGALVAAMPAAAAGDGASKSGAGGAQVSYAVEIRNFAFEPKDLRVPAGARIVWTNRDDEPHVIVSVGGAFKASPALDTQDSYAAVLAKPGTYHYYCGIHPKMVGQIVVR